MNKQLTLETFDCLLVFSFAHSLVRSPLAVTGVCVREDGQVTPRLFRLDVDAVKCNYTTFLTSTREETETHTNQSTREAGQQRVTLG